MASQRALRVVAVAALLAALLSGCSEKREASHTLPGTTAAASTPTLPPLGPKDMPMPADARTKDASGAKAFIRYYFHLLNRSLTNMDPHYLRSFADPRCSVCERIARETEADAAAGYTYSGGELTISGDITIVISAPGEAQSGFTADQAAMTVLDRAGKPVPGFMLPAKGALNSGSITIWDASANTWKLTELTLG